MKRFLLATTLAATTFAAQASVAVTPGGSLMQQTQSIASGAGYRLIWRLSNDAPAGIAARGYENWIDALYGVSQQMSLAAGGAQEAVAPVVCDGSKTLVITTLSDANSIVREGQAYGCMVPRSQ
ncbi:hypothetical protein [Paraburkholderia sp. SIMBA_054]|uniref:hypothetical protein n=1 Tax=Paraburkholderia sp. SIMBA_054 TaxID=3085795 RepID=UPI003979EF1A